MPSNPTGIEDQLHGFRASKLDESLLERLEACAEDVWTRLDPAELEFEHRLRGIAPAPLPDALMASLESFASQVPHPVQQQKILRFPESHNARPGRKSGWWAAAAAVALFGALAGWLPPVDSGNKETVTNQSTPPPAGSSSRPDMLVPAGFDRGLSEASDEGVVWQSANRPHRVLKVVYQERVTLKDSAGRTYQVEQPRVEYILVPAKTD